MSEMNKVEVSSRLGTMPVRKLLLTMAAPMIVSMLVQALYNVVDSIYVSRISEAALTAVSLAFPIQNLMIALSTGIAVGINALLSRSLGSGDKAMANQAAQDGILLGIIGTAAFMFFGLFGAKSFAASQAKDPVIVQYCTTYLQICSIVCVGIFGEIILERLLQSTGKPMLSMFSQACGAIVNIILDPILIFTFDMGIAGAAVATVFSQLVGMGMAIFFNLKMNKELHLNIRQYKPSRAAIGQILSVGIPSALMVAIGSIMNFFMNQILMQFTSTAVAVFGAYFKLQSFVFMPIFGLNNGMAPIVAYNYGAGQPTRIKHTVRLGCFTALSIMLAGLAIFQFIPQALLSFFAPSTDMLKIGTVALRILSLPFVFAGVSIVLSAAFQALGNGMYAMIMSVTRQLTVLLPVAWLLSLTKQLDLVWWSFPIAEVVNMFVCFAFYRKLKHEKLDPLEKQADATVCARESEVCDTPDQ